MRLYAYILYIIIATALTACSSESNLHDGEDISGSTDPMRFTITKESQSQQESRTRASQPLNDGFMVSCYKNYGSENQQTVMPQYEVRYHSSGTAWNGSSYSYWTYDDVTGQYLRYWDFSAFPYRFHAIAPYPANPVGYILEDKSLKINAPYYAQTCHNGMITPADNVAEPHLISQVQRNTDGTDRDLIGTQTEINNASTTKSRDVWMPFHHINSKIRFGIYHTTQWLTANKTYIEHLTVSVSSPSFVTKATAYEATVPGNSASGESWRLPTGTSGFTDLSHAASSSSQPYQIFRFDGGKEVDGNDLTERQTRQTAYFLQCPNGMMQIPQENVEMLVSFDIMNEDGSLYQSFQNVPVRLEHGTDPITYDYTFDWRPGFIYTYYLVIGEIEHKLEITFTATLTPWEDVTGTLSTDLEQ